MQGRQVPWEIRKSGAAASWLCGFGPQLQCPHLQGGLRTVPAVSGGWALQWGTCSEHLVSSEGCQEGVYATGALRETSQRALLAVLQLFPQENTFRDSREGRGAQRPRYSG